MDLFTRMDDLLDRVEYAVGKTVSSQFKNAQAIIESKADVATMAYL